MSADDVARVRAHYASHEAHYARRFSPDRPDARWAWSRLCSELGAEIDLALGPPRAAPDRARILDLGCGSGAALGWLTQRRPSCRALGVDVVRSRLTAAREHGAPLLMADGARLPLCDGAFDVALALTAFSSMPGEAMRRDAAAELLRVVRPQGVVICYEFARKNPGNPETTALDEASLRALFAGADLRVRRVTLHPALRRALFALRLGPRSAAALERAAALRSHLLAVISRR